MKQAKNKLSEHNTHVNTADKCGWDTLEEYLGDDLVLIVPSPHVLNTMRGIMDPEFQTYVREILNHFGLDSQDQNYSFQQVPIF